MPVLSEPDRPSKWVNAFDGRLIPTSALEREQLKACCVDPNKIGQGGFGTVYKTTTDNTFSKRLALIFAVKKVEHQIRRAGRLLATTKRLLHPCLLPLLAAFEDNRIFYFITPYCENGDLYTALKEKRENRENHRVKLNQVMRIRIISQVALALRYLHEAGLNDRQTFYLRNLTSKKILLDGRKNVRLIHEEGSFTGDTSDDRLYKPDHNQDLPDFLDYFSFGVVIRELLTGADPRGKLVHMKDMDIAQVKGYADQEIWPIMEDDDSNEIYDDLNKIAYYCLTDFQDINFMQVIEKLLNILRGEVMSTTDPPSTRCMLCVVNTEGSETARTMQHLGYNCVETLRLCTSCEKNTLVNPVWCLFCGAKFELLGTRWGALLVAANDFHLDTAELHKRNVEIMKDLIMSIDPYKHVMGIRETNMEIVVPQAPGRSDRVHKLILLVMEAMNRFKKRPIDTLVIYISGQSDLEGSKIQLGTDSDDVLTFDVLQFWIAELKQVQKVILFADTYISPLIDIADKALVQLTPSPLRDEPKVDLTKVKQLSDDEDFASISVNEQSYNLHEGTALTNPQYESIVQEENPGHKYLIRKEEDRYKIHVVPERMEVTDDIRDEIQRAASGITLPRKDVATSSRFSKYLFCGLLSRCEEVQCRFCKEMKNSRMNYITGQSLLDFMMLHLPKDDPRPVGFFMGNMTVGFYNKHPAATDFIVDKWAAILVAGFDREKPVREEVYTNDVVFFGTALMNRWQRPYLIGLSEQRISVITPDTRHPRGFGLSRQVFEALDKYNDPAITTLLLYVSCKGDRDREGKYLELDVDDKLEALDLERKLKQLTNLEHIILLVDQRFIPLTGLKQGVLAQLCACHPKKATVYDSQGSRFTFYLRQALKGACDNVRCPYCKELKDSKIEVLSATKLLDFITNHLKRNDSRPFGYFSGNPAVAFLADDEATVSEASEE